MVSCLGGYDIGLTAMERAKKLLYTRELVDSGYTVLLFPEGKIHHKEELGEFQRGLHMLANEDIFILMVRISGLTNTSFFRESRIIFSEVMTNMSTEEKIRRVQDFYGADV